MDKRNYRNHYIKVESEEKRKKIEKVLLEYDGRSDNYLVDLSWFVCNDFSGEHTGDSAFLDNFQKYIKQLSIDFECKVIARYENPEVNNKEDDCEFTYDNGRLLNKYVWEFRKVDVIELSN